MAILFALFFAFGAHAEDGDRSAISERYEQTVALFGVLGCNKFNSECSEDKIAHDKLLGDYCDRLKTELAPFKKFPTPEEYLGAEKIKKCGDSLERMSTDFHKPSNACEKQSAAQKSQAVDTAAREPFEVDPGGAGTMTRYKAKRDVVALAPSKSDDSVVFVIERDNELATAKECTVIQAAAGISKNTPREFCNRLWKEPPANEYGNGEPPSELAEKRKLAHASGISHAKTAVRLDFKGQGACEREIVEKDQKFGEVIAYFRPYSLDVPKICQGLIKHEIRAYWHFVTGAEVNNAAQPSLYSGHYESAASAK
jgi:hypothetical protein